MQVSSFYITEKRLSGPPYFGVLKSFRFDATEDEVIRPCLIRVIRALHLMGLPLTWEGSLGNQYLLEPRLVYNITATGNKEPLIVTEILVKF